jgi:hypothetical protein
MPPIIRRLMDTQKSSSSFNNTISTHSCEETAPNACWHNTPSHPLFRSQSSLSRILQPSRSSRTRYQSPDIQHSTTFGPT